VITPITEVLDYMPTMGDSVEASVILLSTICFHDGNFEDVSKISMPSWLSET
jgi:hypothetical protein